MSRRLFLAVDAGNSKTLAVAADAEGALLGVGRAGAGDIYAVGEERGEAAVALAVDGALAAGGATRSEVKAAAFHLAGVDWPEDETFWRGRIDRMLPALEACVVRNDGFALLRAVDPGGHGLAVTVGTGPAVAARSARREAVMSFWCRDPLGGWGLASRALDAVCLAEQGLAPATALGDELAAAFHVRGIAELLHTVTRRDADLPLPHGARAVLRCAADGDPVARGIVAADATALARYLRPTAERAGLDPRREWPVVLGGSIVTSEIPVYRQELLPRLAAELPEAAVAVTSIAPVLGTLLDAYAVEGPARLAAVHERVTASVLPDEPGAS